MRTFVPGGPALPHPLLRAHEEGRLVFFCGAGVSYYTGLPGFASLVEQTMARCGLPLDPADKRSPRSMAFREGKYDRALHLLERDSDEMRSRVIEILSQPPQAGSAGLDIHKALLTLARIDGGGYRLVTTNFDDRFDLAEPGIAHWQAGPRLSCPRKATWKDLTYLHGKLDPARDPEGAHLVLTSGDFGRAYLQDAWAARFVVELFREFTVLFVGYSLNDPIVGYLIDALAADGQFREAYVLAEYNGSAKDLGHQEDAWLGKGVKPILFHKRRGNDPYRLLNSTLKEWARHHSGGLGSRINEALTLGRKPYLPSVT